VTCLLDAALQLAQSSRPQDGLTAAYILRFLLRLPSFSDVLQTHIKSSVQPADTADATAAAAAAAADGVGGGGFDGGGGGGAGGDDAYQQCVVLLLQLLHRQLEVATVNLLQVSELWNWLTLEYSILLQ